MTESKNLAPPPPWMYFPPRGRLKDTDGGAAENRSFVHPAPHQRPAGRGFPLPGSRKVSNTDSAANRAPLPPILVIEKAVAMSIHSAMFVLRKSVTRSLLKRYGPGLRTRGETGREAPKIMFGLHLIATLPTHSQVFLTNASRRELKDAAEHSPKATQEQLVVQHRELTAWTPDSCHYACRTRLNNPPTVG